MQTSQFIAITCSMSPCILGRHYSSVSIIPRASYQVSGDHSYNLKASEITHNGQSQPAWPALFCLPVKIRIKVLSLPLIIVFSVQFSCSVMSNSLLRPHGLQHARPPCPSPTPGVYSNSCPLSWWCHPTISSSVVPFSSHLQSFPTSGSFQMSQLFTTGGQNIGVSASTSVLPMNTQDWSPLGWTGSPCSPRDSQESSPTPQFKSINSSVLSFLHSPNSHIHTWPLEKP